MEDTLGVSEALRIPTGTIVLILVLMEDTLGVRRVLSLLPKEES